MQVRTAHRKKYNKANTKQTHIVTVLSPSQIARIDLIVNRRDRAICKFLLNTGLRLSEFTELDYGHLFQDIRHKQVTRELALLGKGNKSRRIVLNMDAVKAVLDIDEYNRTVLQITGVNKHTPILVSRQAGRLSPRMVEIMVKEELGCTPHTFRHTCFTNMRKAGIDGTVIQTAAGHSHFSTTSHYYLSVDNNDLAEAFDRLETKNTKGPKLLNFPLKDTA